MREKRGNDKIRWLELFRILPNSSRAEAEEIIAQDEAVEKVKAEHGEFFSQVAALLLRHDVEGINYGQNRGEYSGETATIILRLPECRSQADCRRVVQAEFANWGFRGTAAKYSALSAELWRLWKRRADSMPASASR